MNVSNNLLLYGPPGTGKTYNTVNYAVAIIEGREFEDVIKCPYSENLIKYDKYTKMGRIAFMTFHQSLGYDDFIEGIKPIVAGDDGESLIYIPMPGAFYDFCRKSEFPRSIKATLPDECSNIRPTPSIWLTAPGGFGDSDERDLAMTSGCIPAITWKNEQSPVKGDVILSLFSEDTIDAIGVLTNTAENTGNMMQIKWVGRFNPPESIVKLRITEKEIRDTPCKCAFVTLNEILAMVQYRPDDDSDNGNCVFIIDEINRGNISRIFGEMITLLESSRRKGLPECLEVWLPQMKKMFSIPQNVFVLGTMNTADKSLAALDAALRRRFEFIEMMPEPSVLSSMIVADVNLEKLLTTMNRRIELLYDREHTIGHAYLISIKTMDQLAQCFIKKIIPLLQEYFFDDYEKICWVLGKEKNIRECAFIKMKKRTKFQNSLDLPDVYEIVDDYIVFTDPRNYIGIYEGDVL